MEVVSKTIPNKYLLSQVCKLLGEGKEIMLRAKGNSMFPFIRDSIDTIVLMPLKNDVLEGDIVLALTSDGRYLVHRVLAMSGECVTLMGDGNIGQKESCKMADIHGRAIAVERKGKRISLISPRAKSAMRLWRMLLPVRRYLLAIYR
jgi:SOS-response transcriptional repressor LexA